jgi:hypothetical protein
VCVISRFFCLTQGPALPDRTDAGIKDAESTSAGADQPKIAGWEAGYYRIGPYLALHDIVQKFYSSHVTGTNDKYLANEQGNLDCPRRESFPFLTRPPASTDAMDEVSGAYTQFPV